MNMDLREPAYNKTLLVECEKCKHIGYRIYAGINGNGSQFRRLECAKCKTYVCFIPLPVSVDRADSYVMPFGKHKDKTLGQLLKTNRDYLVWLSENVLDKPVGKLAKELLDNSK